MSSRPPRRVPVQPHGALTEVVPGLHLVQGSMTFGPARFSRNMVVVDRGDGELVLVNSVRLDEAGLAALDALGRVSDVVRLAGGHGADDPFYKDRYDARVWAMAGQRYFEGLDFRKGATYFEADEPVEGEALGALPEARLFHFDTTPQESLLWLPHSGGTVVAGDALQNWAATSGHFNLLGGLGFRLMGFVGPCRLGKGWLDICKPSAERVGAVLELSFENLLPAHGDPVIGGARERFRPAIEAYVGRQGS